MGNNTTNLKRMAGTAVDQVKNGKFARKESVFRDWVTTEAGGKSKFPAEANRYHLYISLARPWATRCLAFIYLKGLEDVIGVSSVHPTWKRTRPNDDTDQHSGWVFADPDNDFEDDSGNMRSAQACTLDTLNGCSSVRDLYDLAVRGIYNKSAFTTPVLWCSKEKTIVNNESSEICRMLNTQFQDFAKNKDLDLYPEKHAAKIKDLEHWIYHDINNGVYKCGFAKTQEAYNEAVTTLFKALDKVESLLEKSRYLCGDELTGIDIWLYMTLVRFDPVYVVYFKTSKRCIREYHNLFNYVKDLYQTYPGIAKSTNMYHIRTHYFTSHPHLNPYGIIPHMPDMDYTESHDRDRAY